MTNLSQEKFAAIKFRQELMVRIESRLALVGQGMVGGLIGSLCCALPAAVIAAGLSGGVAAALVGLGRFRPYLLLAGLAFIALASWFSLRRSRAFCTQEEYKQRMVVVPLTMLITFAVVYGIINYLVVPILYKLPG